jgi:hypothetical protein
MWQYLPNRDKVMCVEFAHPTMNTQVRKPTVRVCEQCGRSEQWDSGVDAWQLVREDGTKQIGNPHCIHEWDITGTFNPISNGTDR